jgi:hypothetical protein
MNIFEYKYFYTRMHISNTFKLYIVKNNLCHGSQINYFFSIITA